MENSVHSPALNKFLNALYEFLDQRNKVGDRELISAIKEKVSVLSYRETQQTDWHQLAPILDFIYHEVNEPCLGMLLESDYDANHKDPLFLNTNQLSNTKKLSYLELKNNPPAIIAKFIQHFAQFYQNIIKVEFNVYRDEYRFTLTPLVENLSYNQLDTCLYGIHKWFTPYTHEKPTRLAFQHKRPSSNSEIYYQRFGISPEYNAEKFEIYYSKSPTPYGDHEYYIELLSRFEKLLSLQRPNRSMSTRCRNMIQILLPLGYANRESICSIFNMSLTTLKRALKKENSSFSELLLEERLSLLDLYLKESDMNVSEVANLLGYKEISQFSNALMNWHGIRPSKYFIEEAHLY